MAMLYLVRHGSSVDQKLIRGRLPGYPLSKKGRRQVAATVKFLADRRITAVYSSPMERAMQTAGMIARSKKLKVKKVEALNEWHAPKIEGKYWSQVSKRLILTYALRPTKADFGDENLNDVAKRITGFCRKAASKNPSVLCVSHRDCILGGKAVLTGRSLDKMNFGRCKPGSVTVLEKADGKWKQKEYFEP